MGIPDPSAWHESPLGHNQRFSPAIIHEDSKPQPNQNASPHGHNKEFCPTVIHEDLKPQPYQNATPQPDPHSSGSQFNPLDEQDQRLTQTRDNQLTRELVLLDKIYKEEDKFGGTVDNFDFKVTVYFDKCRRAGLPSHAYIQGASIMLTGQAQICFYANWNIYL